MIRYALSLLACLFPLFVFADEPTYYPVAQVPNGKTLVLEDGRTIRLAALQTPNLAQDDAEEHEPLALIARDNLQRWVDATDGVRLELLSKERDRHGRVVAVVYNRNGETAQTAQLADGYGWTYTFPDTRKLASDFLKAEREAEIARRGVWSHSAYSTLPHTQTEAHLGSFRLVEGTILTVADMQRNRFLNFGEDWKNDFTLMIEPEHDDNFDPAWVKSLEGKRVRVRGWLFNRNGAMMALTHPEQIEVMDATETASIE